MDVSTRPIAPDDAEPLSALLIANRDFLAPWEPVRPADYVTPDGQRADIDTRLAEAERGDAVPHVIVVDGAVAGRITLAGIVRGSFESANLGYWVGASFGDRGVGTAAVRAICGLAFGSLGLHRIQAGTLVHNVRSQRVLAKAGFTRFGLAPRYLRIAGRWQDHVLFQLLADDPAVTPSV